MTRDAAWRADVVTEHERIGCVAAGGCIVTNLVGDVERLEAQMRKLHEDLAAEQRERDRWAMAAMARASRGGAA